MPPRWARAAQAGTRSEPVTAGRGLRAGAKPYHATLSALLIVVVTALGCAGLGRAQPGELTADARRPIEGYGLRPYRPATREPPPSEQPAGKAAYAGLGLRQNPEGVVVAGVQPGPFGGDGSKSASIWRGDLIVSMNGQSLDLAGYTRLVRSLAAGETLRIVYRRGANADPYSAIPQGDPNGEERSVAVVLDDAANWRGTLGRGLGSGRVIPPAQAAEFEELILSKAEELGLRSPPGTLDALLAYLASLQQRLLDPNSVPAVVHALERPLSLDRVEADIASQVRPLAQPQPLQDSLLALHQFTLRVLDLADFQSRPGVALELSAARHEYERVAASLLMAMRDGNVTGSPEFPQYLQLIRASPQLTPLAVAILPRVAQHAIELEQFAQEAAASPQPPPPDLAERVRAAVEGPVLGARLVDGGLWVVGGDQANRYNMDLIVAVFDTGGADTYAFPAPASGPYQVIIDASGDDLYESSADLAGPAAALFSVSVLNDRSGNDRYVSHRQGAIAAGLFGVAILIDETGDDRYSNDTPGAGWAQGIGFYGAGMLIDRAGDDRYEGQVLAQGVGGPRGIGVIIDTTGNDIYSANGPHFASRYGTPGVFAGLSQGFGLGVRGYAAGGIGAIYDLAGDDVYSVGEYGQGSGYFQGLGILHDGAGNDRYLGSRYAQGSAAHQAAGILVDDAGADSYACPGPAAQAAAWDMSAAMLIDREGDDSYAAGGLAQGSAAQQAVGIHIDLDGQDTYSCSGPCLGRSGDNAYHYAEDKIFNFSASIDRGGKIDAYPRPLSNNELIRTGTLVPDQPGSSECCGLFLDD